MILGSFMYIDYQVVKTSYIVFIPQLLSRIGQYMIPPSQFSTAKDQG